MEEQNLNNEVQKIKEKAEEINNINLVEEILKNNNFEFIHNEVKYKVSKPTFRQKQDANSKRIEKYLEMLNDPKLMMESKLIELYKTKGVDIAEMDNKNQSLEHQKNDLLFQLGKALKEKKSEQELEILRREIQNLLEKQKDLLLKRTILLESSIETQINVFVYSYLTFIVTEKFVEGKWVRAWSTYDEFENTEEDLINKSIFYTSLFSKNDMSNL